MSIHTPPRPARLILTGYIYRDPDGIFVSHCNELETDTCAETLEEVKRLTPHMINGYFVAAEKMGALEETLRRLAAKQAPAAGPAVAARWSAKPKRGRPMQFDAEFQRAA